MTEIDTLRSALAKAEAERDAQSLRADRHFEGHQQACDRLADRIAERDAARAELADAHKQLDEMEREVTASTDDCPHGETTWTCCSYCHLQTRRQRDTAIIEAKALREALERTLLYLTLHEQANPGWNGNRFDDMRFAEQALAAKPDPSLIVVSAASVREREEREARLRAIIADVLRWTETPEVQGAVALALVHGQQVSMAHALAADAMWASARAALANAPDTRLRVVRLPEPDERDEFGIEWRVPMVWRVHMSSGGEISLILPFKAAEWRAHGNDFALALLAAAEVKP